MIQDWVHYSVRVCVPGGPAPSDLFSNIVHSCCHQTMDVYIETVFTNTHCSPTIDRSLEPVAHLFKALSSRSFNVLWQLSCCSCSWSQFPMHLPVPPFLSWFTWSGSQFPIHRPTQWEYKTVYLAKSDGGNELIINFVQWYNSCEHHLLATDGLALWLHHSSLDHVKMRHNGRVRQDGDGFCGKE